MSEQTPEDNWGTRQENIKRTARAVCAAGLGGVILASAITIGYEHLSEEVPVVDCEKYDTFNNEMQIIYEDAFNKSAQTIAENYPLQLEEERFYLIDIESVAAEHAGLSMLLSAEERRQVLDTFQQANGEIEVNAAFSLIQRYAPQVSFNYHTPSVESPIITAAIDSEPTIETQNSESNTNYLPSVVSDVLRMPQELIEQLNSDLKVTFAEEKDGILVQPASADDEFIIMLEDDLSEQVVHRLKTYAVDCVSEVEGVHVLYKYDNLITKQQAGVIEILDRRIYFTKDDDIADAYNWLARATSPEVAVFYMILNNIDALYDEAKERL